MRSTALVQLVGILGACTTTALTSQNRQVVNVADYGAIPGINKGLTCSSFAKAINAARTLATPTLRIPAGTYHL